MIELVEIALFSVSGSDCVLSVLENVFQVFDGGVRRSLKVDFNKVAVIPQLGLTKLPFAKSLALH